MHGIDSLLNRVIPMRPTKIRPQFRNERRAELLGKLDQWMDKDEGTSRLTKSEIKLKVLKAFDKNLTALNLSHRGLKTIPPLINLPQLSKLNLSGNQLESVEAYHFNDVYNLKRLDISDNRLRHTPDYLVQ